MTWTIYVEGGRLTNANIVISDDAADATWAGIVDNDGMLTLASENGETATGENVTVTFTGAGGHPWKAGKSGNTLVTASRTDTYASANFDFILNVPPSRRL